MRYQSLFDDIYYGPEALRLRPPHIASFDELLQALMPIWSGKTLTHYCYRAHESIHVLSADSFEITINTVSKVHIPTGRDLQDACRVKHITINLWDSADVQGLIELLVRELNASLSFESVVLADHISDGC